MADTGDLKSPALTGVRVRVPPSARLFVSRGLGIFLISEAETSVNSGSNF